MVVLAIRIIALFIAWTWHCGNCWAHYHSNQRTIQVYIYVSEAFTRGFLAWCMQGLVRPQFTLDTRWLCLRQRVITAWIAKAGGKSILYSKDCSGCMHHGGMVCTGISCFHHHSPFTVSVHAPSHLCAHLYVSVLSILNFLVTVTHLFYGHGGLPTQLLLSSHSHTMYNLVFL
jgi:hypothetical protein